MLLRVEVPGIASQDVKFIVDQGRVTVRVKKPTPPRLQSWNYVEQNSTVQFFDVEESLPFTLPWVDEAKWRKKREMKDGVVEYEFTQQPAYDGSIPDPQALAGLSVKELGDLVEQYFGEDQWMETMVQAKNDKGDTWRRMLQEEREKLAGVDS